MKGLQSTVSNTTAFITVFIGICATSATVSAAPISFNNVSSAQPQITNVVLKQTKMVPAPASGNDAPDPKNIRTASLH